MTTKKEIFIFGYYVVSILIVAYLSFEWGNENATVQQNDTVLVGSLTATIDSLNSELSLQQIDCGHTQILYDRACKKLTPEELKEIESNIE